MNPSALAEPARVLIVDDSAVARRLLCDVVADAEGFAVAGTAGNGLVALDRIATDVPDVVVLDLEMPVLDGLGALEQIRSRWPELPVVVVSTASRRGATATLDALARGATDYVAKPAHAGSAEAAREGIASALVPVLRACARRRRGRRRLSVVPAAAARSRHVRSGVREVLVVACSTGGPRALGEIVPRLPADLPVPVVAVQHLPATFTRPLAERLDAHSPLSVREGEDGAALEPGTVHLAPGGVHLALRRGAGGAVVLAHDDRPPKNACKPSADVLFASAAGVFGPGVVGLVLTGMGRDGLAGSRAVHEAGGTVYVQDEASSVAWGMPGAVARAGLARAQLALEEIADMLALELRRPLPVGPA